MELDRRTMLAGTGAFPLLPLALGMVRPLERRVLVFAPDEVVGQIVQLIIEQRFGVRVVGTQRGAENVRANLASHPDAFGAVYWGLSKFGSPERRADVWSRAGTQRLPTPFTPRPLGGGIEAVTGWTADLWHRSRGRVTSPETPCGCRSSTSGCRHPWRRFRSICQPQLGRDRAVP